MGEPGGEREKAAACGAVWVMEKFLWGPCRKISGYTPAANGFSEGRLLQQPAVGRPGRGGARGPAPRCSLVAAPQRLPRPRHSSPSAPACASQLARSSLCA